jgi:small subunit ribosomal protein S16
MLKIKLARFGKRKQPHYRIVINEARDKRDGQSVATIGHYAPTAEPKILDIDVKAYAEWIKKGAQPTPTVASLFTRLESGNPFPAKKAKPSKKVKAKQAEAAKAAQEAKAAEAQAKEAAAAAPAETPALEAAEATPAEAAPAAETKTEEVAA